MDKHKSKEGNEKICAALSYLLIGIIWYFADEKMKKDKFAKFHAKQGLVLLGAAILWSIVLNLLFRSFWTMGAWGLWNLLSYVPLVFAVIGIVNAMNHQEKELPLIGKFASKLSF